MVKINRIDDILHFWFNECDPVQWFKKDVEFDKKLGLLFNRDVELALKGGLNRWITSAEGSLALILLLDQMTRNLFRGTKLAFAGDPQALRISIKSTEAGFLDMEKPNHSHFLLMPMMHSETLSIQEQSLPLFEKYVGGRAYESALKHYEVIKKFGRFPHRNIILERKSTESELEFLQQPASSF